MHNLILLMFAFWFSTGLYLVIAELFRIPTYKSTRAILNTVKKNRSQIHNTQAVMMELAMKFSKVIMIDNYKKRKLNAVLKSADFPVTAEVYLAQAAVKAALFWLCSLVCLLVFPLLAPAFLALGMVTYFKESTSAERMIVKRREAIEYELPRFVATLTQQLKASRDVLSMLEIYQKHADLALKQELIVTIADMRTGNYESALTRLEGRVSSPMLSDVVRGLIGVLRGDDGVMFFAMLSHDMKQIELQRLKKLAMERPPKIRRYSFLLLGCMLLLYLGVMGYQILGTMAGLF